MPSGDFASGLAESVARVAPPILSPTPDAELLRLKQLRGDVPSGPAADLGLAPQPFALFAECVTNVATGFAPSDIHGAVAPTRLVVVTNVDIGVYSKATCGIISRVPLRAFFGAFGIPASQTLFDPRVLYDRLSGRCLVTVESRELALHNLQAGSVSPMMAR